MEYSVCRNIFHFLRTLGPEIGHLLRVIIQIEELSTFIIGRIWTFLELRSQII